MEIAYYAVGFVMGVLFTITAKSLLVHKAVRDRSEEDMGRYEKGRPALSLHKSGSALEIDDRTGRVFDPADPKEWRDPTDKEMESVSPIMNKNKSRSRIFGKDWK